MKRIILPALFTGLCLFTSCSKMLDVKSHSAVATNTLSAADVEAFLVGIYNRVQNAPGAESYISFDVVGGNLINAGATSDGGLNTFISNVLRPENGLMSSAWNGYYSALYQVNNLLEAVEGLPVTQRNTEISGIAHFFRAYLYYNLASRWGGVPVLEKNTQEKVKRNTEQEVWAFIEKELQLAIDGAPAYAAGQYYQVSSIAAKALMARVKLAQNKKADAAALAEEVIGSGLFKLDAFEKIFRATANKEEIFSFKNLTIESSVRVSTLFYTYAHPVKGSYVYRPTQEVMDMFSATDKRTAISIDTYQGLRVINKYPSGQSGTDPQVIIRLAEMYLVSAEAQGLAGLHRLNELRAERGLAAIAPADEDAYLDAVLLERRKEFLGEGYRWFDLVRTGKTAELGLASREVKYPIPMNELALNNLLEQNEDY
ncbi:RagB/SusD family nutrient uptake outer membrane protein [Chitinophaga alhagiae]|uniref:RagB/SusD family nutrient uptake outer membrane protein n=1 Tax=Chitinophaga alhagiae TaxID=2203219 RepID=A0ABN5M0M8_9BACT|nr:RagB/SusD family nutrient uptake outer membrane protein [Chitinophaga alhagiae]AWO02172.1 RagB/SusD family nutrient uptake outer membrane protein [Chitinophaga alhagiae]